MPLPPKDKRTTEEVREFLNTVRKRFSQASDAESYVREEAQKDQSFRMGDQWDPKAKQIRDDDNRPCLTINRIPQFIHQVTNEERQSRPSIQIKPAGGPQSLGTEVMRDYADIWQGLIRHIELRSDAETAYDTAFEDQVGQSFGWWRVLTDYVDVDTFDQEILIKRILDPFSVFIDPMAQEPDRSDMKWAFVTTRMSREEFKRLYPTSDLVTRDFFSDFDGGPGAQWITDEEVQIAEYYEVELEKRMLQSLEAHPDALDSLVALFGSSKSVTTNQDGNIELTVFEDEYKDVGLPPGVVVMDERKVEFPHVYWYKLTGYDILDETPWAGRFIPLIPCYGTEVIIKGRKQIISLTRFIRDSQVLLNFFRSQQAEVIALSPKAPFIGATGAFKTHKMMWQKANNTNYAYLEYDPVVLPNGQTASAPMRNTAEPPIQAITEAVRESVEDLYAGTGIYPAALGKSSNETSGIAIRQRQQESDTSNFHFLDNFRRSIRHTGRILMDLIPHIYDRRERIIRIVKPDNTEEMVMINGNTQYKGKPVFFDPSVGRYDVTIDTGTFSPTKIEAVFSILVELAKANPQVMAVAGDLLMQAAPLPGNLGIQLAQRLRAILPPEVKAIAEGNQPKDPQTEAQLMQASQLINALTAEVQKLQETIRTKRMDLESKERIANLDAIVQLLTTELKIGAENSAILTQETFAGIRHRLDLLHESMSMEAEQQQLEQQATQQSAAGQK